MRHEPCGLESYSQGSVELIRADSPLRRAHQVDCREPDVKGDVAVLEDGPDPDSEPLSAYVALVEALAVTLAVELADAFDRAAMWADRTVGQRQDSTYAASSLWDLGSEIIEVFMAIPFF